MPPRVQVDPVPVLAEALARAVEAAAREAVRRHGTFTLAVPGGSVATVMFPRIAQLPIEWRAAHVFLADERAVPADHRDSNYRVARTTLVERGPLTADRLHRMDADAEDIDDAAARYGRELERIAGTRPRLDVALLGIGPDGHIASLFPAHPALDVDDRWVVAVLDSPKPPPRRLTLTLPVLAGADLVLVAVLGGEKASAIHDALENAASPLPVAHVLRAAARSLVLVDPEAAALLSRRPQDAPPRPGEGPR